MSGPLTERERHRTTSQNHPLDGVACMQHAASTRSSGEVRSHHGTKRYSMRSRVGDTAPFSQRRAGRACTTHVLGAQEQQTSTMRDHPLEQMGAVQTGDTPPRRRAGRLPRRVVLEAVARRDGAERLSLALTLLTRASRTPLVGVSFLRPEDHPA